MKIKIYIITLLLSAVLGSCSSSFLDEKPLDFMSATNSFLTQEDIDCSVNNLYYLVRREFYSGMKKDPWTTFTARTLSMMANRTVRNGIRI